MHLVGYDVAAVHRYVFEPVRPVDVLGGSDLLERFARQAEDVARALGADVIYSAGGTGLFQVEGEAAATSLVRRLPATFERLTAAGTRCVAARVESSGDFRADRLRLLATLSAERFRATLDAAPRELLAGGVAPAEVCQGCGRERATETRRAGDRDERIGPRCRTRYEAVPGRTPTLAEVLGGEGDAVPPGAVLAAVYVDADGLGARLAEVRGAEELRRFSSRLGELVRGAVREATGARALPVLQVAVGGDDVLLFCEAGGLPDLTGALWHVLGGASSELGARFSTGVALGEPLLPLRLYFTEVEEALRDAKRRSYATGDPHVGVRALMSGMSHGATGDLLGGPLPQEAFEGEGGVWDLVGRVGSVSPSQRAVLGEELGLPSREETLLAVEYRASRDGDVRQAYELAGKLAARCGVDPPALLAGALAMATGLVLRGRAEAGEER